MKVSILLGLLALTAMLVDCRESMCSNICHVTCDTGEDIYNRWMDMTSEEIAESAEECNKVCDPVCECLNDCIYKCFAQLRDCRFLAGTSVLSIYACHSQFQQCGLPCDDQCASAITLAGTKIQSVRNRIMAAFTKFLYNLWEQMKRPSPTQSHIAVKHADSEEETTVKATDSGEESSVEKTESRKRLSTNDGDSSEHPSENTMDSDKKPSGSEERSDKEDASSEEKTAEETTDSKEESPEKAARSDEEPSFRRKD